MAEPLLPTPVHHFGEMLADPILGEGSVLDHFFDGPVLVECTEFHAEFFTGLKKGLGGVVNGTVVVKLDLAVPIRHHPVDAGQFHLQKLAFEHIRVRGIVGTDQRMIVGIDVRQSFGIFVLGIVLVFPAGPMSTPFSAHGWRFIPRHVVGQDDFSVFRGGGGRFFFGLGERTRQKIGKEKGDKTEGRLSGKPGRHSRKEPGPLRGTDIGLQGIFSRWILACSLRAGFSSTALA